MKPFETAIGTNNVIAEYNKKYGDGTIVFATSVPNFKNICTGIFPLDYAMAGGFIEGQITAIVGYEGSGKSTTSLKLIASTQDKYPDCICAYTDFEGSFDALWAEKHGVDLSRLLLLQPTTAEQGSNMIQSLLEEPTVKLVIVDSLPAMITSREIDDSTETIQVGVRAAVVAKMLNKCVTVLQDRRRAGNSATVIILNQWRVKVGGNGYGDTRHLPAGEQQKYSAFARVDLGRAKEILGKVGRGEEIITHTEHEFTLIKFKGPKRVRAGKFDMIRRTDGELPSGAVDDYGTVLTYAKRHGLLTGGGQHQRLAGIDQVFKTMADMRTFLIANPLEYTDLKAKLIAMYRIECGLPALPPDNYLLRFHGTELSIPEGLVEGTDDNDQGE